MSWSEREEQDFKRRSTLKTHDRNLRVLELAHEDARKGSAEPESAEMEMAFIDAIRWARSKIAEMLTKADPPVPDELELPPDAPLPPITRDQINECIVNLANALELTDPSEYPPPDFIQAMDDRQITLWDLQLYTLAGLQLKADAVERLRARARDRLQTEHEIEVAGLRLERDNAVAGAARWAARVKELEARIDAACSSLRGRGRPGEGDPFLASFPKPKADQ